MPISVAVDGPAGSGKSTLAKLLAKKYGFIYIDTGALYRTVGLYVCNKGIASDDTAGIVSLLTEINIEIKFENNGGRVYLNGRPVGDEIRTPEIARYASDVSKIPDVREFLLDLQRKTADNNNIVMDGRDIGTVILPHAQVKIFMTADDTQRAKRRLAELKDKGIDTTLEKVLNDMRLRDSNDKNRKIAPAVPAADAVILDNTNLDAIQTLEAASVYVDAVLSEVK